MAEMKMICRAVFLLSILLYSSPAMPLVGDFKCERIKITIDSRQAAVDGTYWFKARVVPAKISILYPFPKGCYPDSITVEQQHPSGCFTPVKFSAAKDSSGVFFDIVISDTALAQCRVWYRQPLKSKEFQYILKSTRSWDNPLDSASFIIEIPKMFNKQTVSYQPDSIDIIGDFIVYSFKRTAFWPAEDLLIYWE
jgi:hypothetical protein